MSVDYYISKTTNKGIHSRHLKTETHVQTVQLFKQKQPTNNNNKKGREAMRKSEIKLHVYNAHTKRGLGVGENKKKQDYMTKVYACLD